MTTTVLIGTQGNKAVRVQVEAGDYVVQPGRWLTINIHGDQKLVIAEDGEFVHTSPGYAFSVKPGLGSPGGAG